MLGYLHKVTDVVNVFMLCRSSYLQLKASNHLAGI